jgi:adenylate cyclase
MSAGGDDAFFRLLETHRVRTFVRLMRHLPRDPRCAICGAPYGGVGGRVMGRLGFAPSRKNPRICSLCFEKAPMGGVEMNVGILFADLCGFTSLAERRTPDAVATLLNRFYATAVDVVCEHAIIDKLIGDQIMALYLPGIFPGEPADHMVSDAQALLLAAGYDSERPWVELGIGLDFGTAFVGNVGSGEVKDFTAIGDVVNTAARLQAAAASCPSKARPSPRSCWSAVSIPGHLLRIRPHGPNRALMRSSADAARRPVRCARVRLL